MVHYNAEDLGVEEHDSLIRLLRSLTDAVVEHEKTLADLKLKLEKMG